LTIKIVCPESSRIVSDDVQCCAGAFRHLMIGKHPVFIMEVANPCDTIIGTLRYRLWAPALPIALSVAAGIAFAIPFQFLTSMSTLAAGAISAIVGLGIVGFYRFISRGLS
jgi:hypothetical protein